MEHSDVRIVRCTACGAGNRIPAERLGRPARCGKCQAPLPAVESSPGRNDAYKMRCTACSARNKIPADRIDARPKCGKCGTLLKTEELFVPQPITVTDGNFDHQVLKSPLPVLLFAWAPWCPTCGAVSPIIDEFASESKGRVRVGKLNVDASPGLSQKFSIMSVPFLFIFDNGRLQASMPGGLQKHEIMMKMAPYI